MARLIFTGLLLLSMCGLAAAGEQASPDPLASIRFAPSAKFSTGRIREEGNYVGIQPSATLSMEFPTQGGRKGVASLNYAFAFNDFMNAPAGQPQNMAYGNNLKPSLTYPVS